MQFGHKAASEVEPEDEDGGDVEAVDKPPEPGKTWTLIRPRGRFVSKKKQSIIHFHKSGDERECDCNKCLGDLTDFVENGAFINQVEEHVINKNGDDKLVKDVNSVDRSVNEVLPEDAHHKGWERIRVQIDSGAVDTVGPKSAGKAFPINPTKASKAGKNYIAANGSAIKNYGERVIKGDTDNCITVSMPMQVADVKRVLMSTHKMNETGLKVVLDGVNSYFVEKRTGKSTPIKYEHGKYLFDIWAPGVNHKSKKKNDDDMDTTDEVEYNKAFHKNKKFWVFGTDDSPF